ncbi:radical SAM family heme chaperone HemW [Venenivibrio stagnispumantis]|uniref:Heme chaperone HemW n=1 Tax=Venenivibrio stagnispumantis TaxID=407998 RepID=A0AA45WN16_9AQUI|nr:radical SAM family heme chaperone HemW [Venenivibrio stagnispumantis]MCW4573580.1 radical SAM family heme chaperone HemW [Venenivibrio stagnispumantis]SMP16706.1 coproporphyrinogen III oxidase, anaerobic [Venenivibrio stagnispumantis]
MVEGLYIHIPFCSIKCPYCDFTSITILDEDIHKRYIDRLFEELNLYKDLDWNLKTVYFGGGTPSVLNPKYIVKLIEFVKNNHKNIEEITIEVNPKTYKYEEFKILKDIGVNRVSIGNQSFLQKNLKILGRNHSPEDTYKTIESALKAGINNINLDLIYGISSQTIKDLEEDLKIYTSLPILHISAYMLTVYEGTALANLVNENKYNEISEDLATKMFYIIDEYLENKGFLRYELSNWAKEGAESKHNLLYWQRKEYIGIGVSAWSFVGNRRFGNTKNLNEYIEGKGIGKYEEILDEEKIKEEEIFLGFRLKEGVSLDILKDKMEILKDLEKENLLYIKNNRAILTRKGLMVINYIVSKLI